MNNLIAQIEKMKPFFEKVSRNKYLDPSEMVLSLLCR